AERKRHAADQRVEGIGRGLRERDVGRAAGVTDEVGQVGARRVERGVVRVVSDVREHPDAREPCAIAIGNARRDREGRAGPRDDERAAQPWRRRALAHAEEEGPNADERVVEDEYDREPAVQWEHEVHARRLTAAARYLAAATPI